MTEVGEQAVADVDQGGGAQVGRLRTRVVGRLGAAVRVGQGVVGEAGFAGGPGRRRRGRAGPSRRPGRRGRRRSGAPGRGRPGRPGRWWRAGRIRRGPCPRRPRSRRPGRTRPRGLRSGREPRSTGRSGGAASATSRPVGTAPMAATSIRLRAAALRPTSGRWTSPGGSAGPPAESPCWPPPGRRGPRGPRRRRRSRPACADRAAAAAPRQRRDQAELTQCGHGLLLGGDGASRMCQWSAPLR